MFVVPFARIFWDLWFTNRKLLVPSISLLSWKSKRKMGLLFWEWSMACFIVGKWIVAISVEQKPKSFCMIVHACVCSIQKEGFMSIKIWIGGFPMTSMTTFASKVLMPHPFSKTQVPDFPAWPTWAGEQRQGQGQWLSRRVGFFSKETSTSKPTTSDLRTRVLWRQVLEHLTEPSDRNPCQWVARIFLDPPP